MTTTINYGLKKPTGAEYADKDLFNENADIIDIELKKAEDHRAASNPHEITPEIIGADPLGSSLLVKTPAGCVSWFGGIYAPFGWLICDGRPISRATYNDLFSAIGTLHGVGDGTTTFNLPDLRGEFIRGLDNGRGVDPGRAIGSKQAGTVFWQKDYGARIIEGSESVGTGSGALGGSSSSGSSNLYATHPRNVALLPIIKY